MRLAIALAFRWGDVALATVVKAYANKNCGYDLRELLVDQPLDGERKKLPCARCGRTVTFVRPAPDETE